MRWTIMMTLVVVVGVAGMAAWLAWPPPEADVVLYCSVDQDQSERLLDVFRQETALSVDFQADVEADKSVGLAQRLSREKAHPRADVFWANEIMNTVWLAEADVLDPLPAAVLELFPARWRDPQGRWVAFGLRARVLMVNTQLLPDKADWPKRVSDLLDPMYAQRGLLTAIAAPLTGTTYTHAVALLTQDEGGAKTFLEAVMAAVREGRVKLTPSNGSAMSLAKDASNKVAFCLTDTDDAWAAKQQGFTVEVVYPDQGAGEVGTFVIPNTLALVKGRAHPENAERLLRWLASPSHEARLAAGPSAQMPVREGVAIPADGHVKRPGVDFRVAETDWLAVGRNRDRWLDLLTRLFRPAN